MMAFLTQAPIRSEQLPPKQERCPPTMQSKDTVRMRPFDEHSPLSKAFASKRLRSSRPFTELHHSGSTCQIRLRRPNACEMQPHILSIWQIRHLVLSQK